MLAVPALRLRAGSRHQAPLCAIVSFLDGAGPLEYSPVALVEKTSLSGEGGQALSLAYMSL